MYERNRAAAESLHKNEETLKKAMAAYQERLQQEQHKYETLKQHAAQKLEAYVFLLTRCNRFRPYLMSCVHFSGPSKKWRI